MENSASRLVTRASAQPLKNPDELVDSVETFIFDCDGIISFWFFSFVCYRLMINSVFWLLLGFEPLFIIHQLIMGSDQVNFFYFSWCKFIWHNLLAYVCF